VSSYTKRYIMHASVYGRLNSLARQSAACSNRVSRRVASQRVTSKALSSSQNRNVESVVVSRSKALMWNLFFNSAARATGINEKHSVLKRFQKFPADPKTNWSSHSCSFQLAKTLPRTNPHW
jgi:hypothetical protein